MNAKVIIPAKKRLIVKAERGLGIKYFDSDNMYPQRYRDYIGSSGIATSCTKLLKKFVNGGGLADKALYKAQVNSDRLTMDKLHRAGSKDYSYWAGFAIHVNWNIQYQIRSLTPLPFEHVRWGEPEVEGAEILTVKIYDNWDKNLKKNIDKEAIDEIYLYNPDPAVIQAQVEASGGWHNYKGQVYYYTGTEKGEYPLAHCDSFIDEIHADAGTTTYKTSTIDTGFHASNIFVHKGKFETPTKRKEFEDSLIQFMGAENAGSVMVVEAEEENQIPEMKPLINGFNDKLFTVTEQSTKTAIIQGYGQPPILLSVLIAGKLGNADEVNDNIDFYNEATADDRLIFEECYAELIPRFERKLSTEQNFSILPVSGLSTGVRVRKDVLPEMMKLLESSMVDDKKVNNLMIVFNITEDEAKKMVYGNAVVN